jgi:TRAP transporter TAXI family solute receptor
VKDFFKIWFPILLIIGAIFYFSAQFIKPEADKVLNIATGRSGGSYYEYAMRYKKLLQEYDIKVKIIETAGSLETLKLLKEHKVDIGFVQGGTVDIEVYKDLESIASIYYEPLWLFMKKSDNPIKYISQLQSKRVSIGEEESGTSALVVQIAEANELKADTTTIENLSLLDSYKALKKSKLDAFFSVISADSPLILNLLKDTTIEAVSLKRIKAYEKNFSYLKGLTIYEGSLDLINNLPKNDIHLLSTTATLAVHKDVDDTLVRLFTKVVKYENRRADGFPSLEYLELPINAQAKKYMLKGDSILEKFFPYWIASNLDRLKIMIIPLLTLLIPLFKGFLPLYRWRIRSKIYKWYKQLDYHGQRWERYDKKNLADGIKELETLQKEVKDVNVPLPYMSEYYMLTTHVDFILQKMLDNYGMMKEKEIL